MSPQDRIAAKLAQVKEMAEKATPGPWLISGDKRKTIRPVGYTPLSPVISGEGNRAFIAASRELVPALVAALEKAIEHRDAAIEYGFLEQNAAILITRSNEEIADLLDGKGGE